MAFGTGLRLKSDVAEGVASTVGAARGPPRRPRRRRHGRRAASRDVAAALRPRRVRRRAAAGRRRRGARRAAAELPLAGALERVRRLARTRGLVAVISDFRDDGWQAPLRALAQRHTVTAIEIADPREAELPDAGQLVLMDPETGAHRRGRHGLAARPRRVRRRRGRAPRAGRRGDPARPRAPRDPVHRRRLAARARAGAAMTLDAPTCLLALLVIPPVAAVYALARSAPPPLRGPLPGGRGVRPRRRGQPRLRRVLPPALLAAAAATLAVAVAKPQATVAVPVEKASVMLVTDESGSMSATDVDPSRLAAAQSAAESFLDKVPEVAARRLRRLLVADERGRRADARPRRRSAPRSRACRPTAAPRPATRSSAALDRLAARRGKDGKRRRPR